MQEGRCRNTALLVCRLLGAAAHPAFPFSLQHCRPPLPLKPQDPAVFFEDLDYRATGNLFWPDFWAVVDKKDIVFDIVGLDYEKAAVRIARACGRACVVCVLCVLARRCHIVFHIVGLECAFTVHAPHTRAPARPRWRAARGGCGVTLRAARC